MHTTTLRGVFPEPKPTYRRNFIKENVKSIKQMQGLLQEAGVIQPRATTRVASKLKTNPPISKSRDSIPLSSSQQKSSVEKFKNKVSNAKPVKDTERQPLKPRVERRKESSDLSTPSADQRFSHRSVQTERTDDLNQLYQTGVIKYPSKDRAKNRVARSPPPTKLKDSGAGDAIEEEMQNLELEDKDFIKENKQNLRPKPVKPANMPKVPAQPPPTYQRGALPRYLRERREEEAAERDTEDAECPPGHVLLPEEERKETLRVLRQSYADRIQELNMMPVRNDTLKMKKRKMEIEEELKKIDGGIKVFQRPKVYVKINA